VICRRPARAWRVSRVRASSSARRPIESMNDTPVRSIDHRSVSRLDLLERVVEERRARHVELAHDADDGRVAPIEHLDVERAVNGVLMSCRGLACRCRASMRAIAAASRPSLALRILPGRSAEAANFSDSPDADKDDGFDRRASRRPGHRARRPAGVAAPRRDEGRAPDGIGGGDRGADGARDVQTISRLLPVPSDGALTRLKDTLTSS
jgi:hypothetical protein